MDLVSGTATLRAPGMKAPALTHEQFVHDVRAAAVARALAGGTVNEAEASRILSVKLVYGAGGVQPR